MAITKINKLPDNVVSTTKVADNTVVNADINSCAAIAQSKLSGLSTSLSNICSSVTSATADNTKNAFNIGLLGFKMAVNESLTVFNLVDGVVDEFNDESGTDEAEGSNDTYCASSDFYSNSLSGCISAGFSLTTVTEPDTSTTGTNPAQNSGQMGTFTVPCAMTSVNIQVWGAGGGGSSAPLPGGNGGGGGYSEGTLAVTGGQSIKVIAGEGGRSPSTAGGGGLPSPQNRSFLNGGRGTDSGTPSGASSGGGLSGTFSTDLVPLSQPQYSAPTAYVVAGSGGGGGGNPAQQGGAGGGLTGCRAGTPGTESTSNSGQLGGGGGQSSGGIGGEGAPTGCTPGSLFRGGDSVGNVTSGGGAGYYGGGGGNDNDTAGGGSSYYGHPQVTSGSTEEGSGQSGGGTGQPGYVACTNEGKAEPNGVGEDGYVLMTGSFSTAQNTTIISSSFTSTTVPTTSRIVVFEENIDTPTLNTDIIASVSRDGTNFTNATLSDSGYVTGSSGQRVLTGQVDISGQPSGQSMRWKLQLANNQVKIHGVSLSWA